MNEVTSDSISIFFKKYLDEPNTTDILVNSSNQIFLDNGNGLCHLSASSLELTPESLRQWVVSQLSQQGKSWDAKFPFADFQFLSQHRVHACFPPIHTNGILISIRKIPDFKPSLQNHNMIQKNWENCKGFDLLKKALLNKETILVCGATGSGKTTLTQSLLSIIPESERIIALEDTPELSPCHSHFIRLLSKPPNSDGFGEVTLKDLLKQTLRMRPDRIILGECRGDEVLELLQLLNTGHRGTIATLHANSSRDALRRLELLCSIASKGMLPSPLVKELISEGIQWIVHISKSSGTRRINEICQLAGKEGDTILLRQMLV